MALAVVEAEVTVVARVGEAMAAKVAAATEAVTGAVATAAEVTAGARVAVEMAEEKVARHSLRPRSSAPRASPSSRHIDSPPRNRRSPRRDAPS